MAVILQSNAPPFLRRSLTPYPPSLHLKSNNHIPFPTTNRSISFTCQSVSDDSDDGYLLDAPVSAGDGFSFSGGKYSDGPNPADEWFKKGKYMKAHPVYGTGEKAKDPIFSLTMGGSSQSSTDVFRWFCVESGNVDKLPVILIHGFSSQAYSYHKVLPLLSKDYHAITFDCLSEPSNLALEIQINLNPNMDLITP